MTALELIEILKTDPRAEVVIMAYGERDPKTRGVIFGADHPRNFTPIEHAKLRGNLIAIFPKNLI